MGTPWEIRIFDRQEPVFATEATGPVELGRQAEGEPAPFCSKPDGDRCRVIIARLDEDTVSRKHVLVEPLPYNLVKVTNRSGKLPIRLPNGSDLAPGASAVLPLPAALGVGRKTTIRIQEPGGDGNEHQSHLQSLPEATIPPGRLSARAPRLGALGLPAGGMEMESLLRWLQAAQEVLHSATGSLEFFARAARAVVELVGLDSGHILICENEEWTVKAAEFAPRVTPRPEWQPSRRILSCVRQEKRTFWQVPEEASDASDSWQGIGAVVAAPVLNSKGEVIGALYGDRRPDRSPTAKRAITKLEAMMVELLASGVAAGLARVEQEKAAVSARVQFEQFFTPELSRQLALDPDLLQGREAEVSILFCDIRGFSRISERLGSERTVEWLEDVMGTLSECVLAERGVLVDYIGDELMAMWGAPETQADHARLACRAALAMLDCLPKINEKWEPVLQEPMALGIGINAGRAHVGNTGSKKKFKYGPLGNTVNLASRVQGATRYLKSWLLITGTVHAQLDASFVTRRLSTVRVVNIRDAVDLYELAAPEQPAFAVLKQGYEEALQLFEAGEFRHVVRILGKLLSEYPHDGPSLALLSRAVKCLADELDYEQFSPIWDLPRRESRVADRPATACLGSADPARGRHASGHRAGDDPGRRGASIVLRRHPAAPTDHPRLRDHRRARSRRHGHRLPGAPGGAQPRRGPQDDPGRCPGPVATPGPLPRRGGGPGAAPAPQHRAGLRGRRTGRPAVLLAGVRGRRQPGTAHPAHAAAAPAERRADRGAGPGRARRPPARHHSPRPEARQHPADERRYAEGYRLRPGQTAGRPHRADAHGRHHGDAELHGPRAGPGSGTVHRAGRRRL
jgi:adenylate cyclase